MILFAHSHQEGTWHREGSLDNLVEKLRWDAVTGFSYLQPNPDAFKSVYVQNATQNLAGRALLPPYQDKADFLDCSAVSFLRIKSPSFFATFCHALSHRGHTLCYYTVFAPF